MTVHLDTSVLIDALTGPRRALPQLVALVTDGHRVSMSSLVLYEWLRGPRTPADREAQEALFPSDAALPLGPAEARIASSLYAKVTRPRGREIDLAIAACAISQGATLWTLNSADFKDVPGLALL